MHIDDIAPDESKQHCDVITVSLPKDLLKEIGNLVEFAKENGRNASRSSVIRNLLYKSIQESTFR